MTRKSQAPFFLALMLVLLASACSPGQMPVTGATAGPTVPALPTLTSPNAAAILQAVPAGPPAMQAGSAYRYFDGSLLDAVPNDGPVMLGGSPDEVQRQVTVSDFWIYSTEVTNQMYAWCVGLGKCKAPDPKDNPNFGNAQFVNYPVVGVTWQQASDYCGFAHGQLPTEAQWEKAAGWDATAKQQRLYPWGPKAPSCDLLNFKNCIGRATSVLQYGQGQSFYGVFNMAGNVAEWVGDWYQAGYKDTAQDPHGPAQGTQRSIRGSAYDSDAILASPARRFFAAPAAHRPNLGFRCVVKDPAYFAAYCQMPIFYGISPTGSSANNPCPDPTVRREQTCGADLKVHNFITIQSTGSTLVQVTGMESCMPSGNDIGKGHECGPNITIKVTASCNVKAAGVVTCPPNYHQDPSNPNRCISLPGAGACPAGFQYDQTLQCCSAATNSDLSTPICSVGQHPYNGACVDDSSGLLQPHSLSFSTGTASSCVPGQFSPNQGGGPTATLIPFPTTTPPPAATSTNPPQSTATPQSTEPPTQQPTQQPTQAPTQQPTNPPPPTQQPTNPPTPPAGTNPPPTP